MISVYNAPNGGIMPKKVIVLLADGFEEVEAITPIDYLRRAGIEVTTASISNEQRADGSQSAKGSHDIEIKTDTSIFELKKAGKFNCAGWDGVIVPGGLPGSDNLAASKETGEFLTEMAKAGKFVCAICAAPARVLSPLGILANRKFTCFPGEEAKVLAPESRSCGAEWKTDRVVIDGNIITSRGAGTAGEFACAVIGVLAGEEEGKKIAERVLLKV